MVNERLRRAMLRADHDPASLAEAVGVSTKSAERWLSGEVTPYPRTRFRVATVLREDESYLWPDAVDTASLRGAELAATYPRRTDVPRDVWTDLLRSADRNVDVLAFAGLFLTEEHRDWIPLLKLKAEQGARVRILLGDPRGEQVAKRDREHEIGGGVTGRILAVLSHYKPLKELISVRLHDTPLYNSIYRFDDDMLINVHVYGILAAYTPVIRIRRIDGQYFNTYTESFDRIWVNARPFDPEESVQIQHG
jgi:transcriptional regulator with XRE-family HTH domain